MTTPQNMALAFLLGQQKEVNAETETENNARVMALFTGKAPKAKAAKAPKAKRAPKEETVKPKSAPPAVAFNVTPGSVGPEGFLKLMRTAKDRQQSIEAIHAYVGYDMAGDFGTQEYRANAQAKRELKPIVIGAKALPVMQGYVAGMPNPAAKFHQDLSARERMAVENLIDNDRQSETASNPFDKDLKAGLAQVEAERIRVIRADRARALGQRTTIIGIG